MPLICCILFIACKKTSTTTPAPQPTFFAKGADISWITEMEAAGKKFYDSTGKQQDLIDILKGYDMNTIRLRVWVNPVGNSWNNATDVAIKALRAKNKGMKIMIDFHYSDSWADPGQQYIPDNWKGRSFDVLKDSLKQHTIYVLNRLKLYDITPDWVQVGNEVNDGMLWPTGKASASMSNFAQLIKAGYDAVKSVSPATKVIVHLSNGFDNSLYRWIFDGLKSNGVDWDVIGMSLYPSTTNWATLNAQCLGNMNDMVTRYGKEVMIVEIGMSWDQPKICHEFISDLIAKTKMVNNGKGKGVLYWEPQSYNWYGYPLGAFDLTGKPTEALYGFK